MTTVFKLAQSLTQAGKADEAKPYFDEREDFEHRGISSPGVPDHQPDTLGAIQPHTPSLFDLPAPKPTAARFIERRFDDAGAPAGVRVVQLAFGSLSDVSTSYGANKEELYRLGPVASVVGFGPGGITLTGEGATGTKVLLGEATADLVPFDRMNVGANKGTDIKKKEGDQDLDLLWVTSGGTLRLLENVEGEWTPREEPLAELPPIEGPGRMLEVDYDHDGDVDLLVASADGPRLLRNDGLDGSGGFTDVTTESGLPSGDFLPISEDVDNDNDVDFLLVDQGDGSVRLASNERGGRFSDATSSLPTGLRGRWIVPADFDGDGWVDLAAFDGDLALYTRTALGGWKAEPERLPLALEPTGPPKAVDWDLDGAWDLLWPCAESPAAGLLAPGFETGGVAIQLGEPYSSPTGVGERDAGSRQPRRRLRPRPPAPRRTAACVPI